MVKIKVMGDELKRKYEKIYKDGKESFFSIFEDGENISETEEVVWKSPLWFWQNSAINRGISSLCLR